MSTSDKRSLRASAKGYFTAALCCFVFGIVYECFSHGVYSPYMLFAFLLPLLGAIPDVAVFFFARRMPGERSRSLWMLGITALTIGSIIRGVLDIYGTTNRLNAVYLPLGALLIVLSIVEYKKH